MAGRGRGKTLPAWMTSSDEALSVSINSTLYFKLKCCRLQVLKWAIVQCQINLWTLLN